MKYLKFIDSIYYTIFRRQKLNILFVSVHAPVGGDQNLKLHNLKQLHNFEVLIKEMAVTSDLSCPNFNFIKFC